MGTMGGSLGKTGHVAESLAFWGAPRGPSGRFSVKVLGCSAGVKKVDSSRGDTRVGTCYRSRDKAVHTVPLPNSRTFLLFPLLAVHPQTFRGRHHLRLTEEMLTTENRSVWGRSDKILVTTGSEGGEENHFFFLPHLERKRH